ncbi:MAG: hypothetical protein ACK5MV_01265 [Aminipila sp.]
MKKKIAIVLLFAFIFIFAFSFFISSEHDCSKCQIENCFLCHLIEKGHELKKLLSIAASGLILHTLFISLLCLSIAKEIFIKRVTPITLRVKMLN